MGVHGHSRRTDAIDILVNRSTANAVALSNTLVAFGFSPAAVDPSTLLPAGRVVRIGVPPLRIDILTSVSGLDFDAAYSARSTISIDGVDVDLISREDLLKNKRATGRPKDLADLDALG